MAVQLACYQGFTKYSSLCVFKRYKKSIQMILLGGHSANTLHPGNNPM